MKIANITTAQYYTARNHTSNRANQNNSKLYQPQTDSQTGILTNPTNNISFGTLGHKVRTFAAIISAAIFGAAHTGCKPKIPTQNVKAFEVFVDRDGMVNVVSQIDSALNKKTGRKVYNTIYYSQPYAEAEVSNPDVPYLTMRQALTPDKTSPDSEAIGITFDDIFLFQRGGSFASYKKADSTTRAMIENAGKRDLNNPTNIVVEYRGDATKVLSPSGLARMKAKGTIVPDRFTSEITNGGLISVKENGQYVDPNNYVIFINGREYDLSNTKFIFR